MTGRPRNEGADALDVQIGHMIRIQRRIRGMSQHELSRRLGVTFQQVQKYEKGKSRIAASRLYDIARTMNLPVETFFDGLKASQGTREAVYDIVERFRVIAPQFGFHEFMDLNRAFPDVRSRPIRAALLRLIDELAARGGGAQAPAARRGEGEAWDEGEIGERRPAPRLDARLPDRCSPGESGEALRHSVMAPCENGETVG